MTSSVGSSTSSGATGVSLNAHVRVYSQSSPGVLDGYATNAIGIGTMKNNTNLLTVYGSLAASQDQADYYTFKASENLKNVSMAVSATSGDTNNNSKLTGTTTQTPNNKSIRVQLLDKTGQHVVADSSTNATASQAKAYSDLQAGTLSLSSGQYVLKVSRGSGTLDTSTPSYTVQVKAGTYTAAYNTTKTAAPAVTATSSILAASLNATAPDGSATTNIFDSLAGTYAMLDISA